MVLCIKYMNWVSRGFGHYQEVTVQRVNSQRKGQKVRDGVEMKRENETFCI